MHQNENGGSDNDRESIFSGFNTTYVIIAVYEALVRGVFVLFWVFSPFFVIF